MKFKNIFCLKRNPEKIFEETCIENVSDPDAWGKEIIQFYNDTIPKYGGEERVFLRTEIIDPTINKHEWKKNNLMTLIDEKNHRTYDEMECTVCHITGKRYDISHNVTIDKKYQADKYKYCKPDLLTPKKTTRKTTKKKD